MARVPLQQNLTQELAAQGAATAAAEVAENIPQEQGLLESGAIDLSEQAVDDQQVIE